MGVTLLQLSRSCEPRPFLVDTQDIVTSVDLGIDQ
jgi:hypothetical protein